MNRWLGATAACVLAGAVVISAQQTRPPARGGGGGTPPAKGQGAGQGAGQAGKQSQELKDAREALQRDVAEGKRLQNQLKIDRKAGDKSAVQRDNDEIK